MVYHMLTVYKPQSDCSVETHHRNHFRDDGYDQLVGEIKQRKNANISCRCQGEVAPWYDLSYRLYLYRFIALNKRE